MEQTVARNELPDETRAKALWALAACVYGSGDDERLMAISEEGVAVSRKIRDARAEAYLVGMGGFAAPQLGDLDRATRDLEESLRLDRELGDDWAAAHILTHLAVVPLRQGNFPRVAAYAEEALELTDRTGDRLAANIALYLPAQSALASGEHAQAARYFQDALVLTFEVSDLTNAVTACKDSPRSPKHRASRAAPPGCSGPRRRCSRPWGHTTMPRWTTSC